MIPRLPRLTAAVVAAVAVVAASLALATGAGAQGTSNALEDRQDQIERELRTLQGDLHEASEEEADLFRALTETQARKRVIDAEVADLDAQVRSANGQLAAAEQGLHVAEQELAVADAALRVARADLISAQNGLRDQAISAYTGQNTVAALTQAVLAARSFEELHSTRPYLTAVVDAQMRVVDEHRRAEADHQHLVDATDAALAEATRLRDELRQRRAELADAKAARQAIQADVDSVAARESALLREAQQRKAEFERRIAQLEEESASITAFLKRRQSQGEFTGILQRPIPGARITSSYGPRVHPIYGTTRYHYGIDFGASQGTPVRAAAAGEVLLAGVRGGYGNTVVVDHGGSLATLSAHLSAFAVSPGDVVSAGEVIGYVGSTGLSTGPHLHFETRVNGEPVDPMQFF